MVPQGIKPLLDGRMSLMPKQLLTIRESFFNTVFSLLGHIANCDGFINRNEIKRVETYMEKMSLSEKCKHEAQHLFRAGASPQFSVSQVLKEFSKNTSPNLIQILLVYLISMARTDGLLVKKEMQVVQQVARELGYTSIVFDHLLKMISAQDEFASPASNKKSEPQPQPQPGQASQDKQAPNQKQDQKSESSSGQKSGSRSGQKSESHSEKKSQQGKSQFTDNSWFKRTKYVNPHLHSAFEALGVTEEMSDEAIKKAYQKLVSQFHPDKLVGQGMPPDLVNAATERFKKIQAAYEYIKKYHHISVVA
jgi:DnaJ like chaperone protein